jgi:nicotinamide mononucleotide transporter PnuC
VGVTSLIFCAKGNPVGQVLMIIFSIIYAVISYSFDYYGEMITYIGMTLPMAAFSLISWLRNPFKGNRAEVTVNRIKSKEWIFMFILSAVVTVIFYFILRHFNTANIIPSTISITTSFIAAYLTFRRTIYFGLAYAMNDIVLIVMWIMASLVNHEYIPVVVCFVVFFVNDIYGFINWIKIQKRQINCTKTD